jgi:hypothetical protein
MSWKTKDCLDAGQDHARFCKSEIDRVPQLQALQRFEGFLPGNFHGLIFAAGRAPVRRETPAAIRAPVSCGANDRDILALLAVHIDRARRSHQRSIRAGVTLSRDRAPRSLESRATSPSVVRRLPSEFSAIALFSLLGLAAAGGLPAARAQSPARNLEPVTLQLKWKHQFQFAGYYAAIEKGYYRDAGFEVSLAEPSGNEDPVDMVLTDKAQFGVGASELVLHRARGEAVVVLATILQHSPLVL